MKTVTICMPAFLSGPEIADALRSLQRQTYREILVRIAVEPPVEQTLDRVAPFLNDSRFSVDENPVRLGWDGNIRALLSKVETEAFMVLPHDDMLHRRAVEVLLGHLERAQDASVAYPDMHVFGHDPPRRKVVDLPRDGTRADQVLAFFLAGAEAVPWRGICPADVIERSGGFPTDGFKGFAVECEWALNLLLLGRAVRVPERLYFKRSLAHHPHSASRERVVGRTEEQLHDAWQRHRTVMLEAMAVAVPPDSQRRPLVEVAAELAMLERRVGLARLPMTVELRDAALELASKADAISAHEPVAVRLAHRLRDLADTTRPDLSRPMGLPTTTADERGASHSSQRSREESTGRHNGRSADVAVLGAGIMGCCLALELARRGYAVDLLDAAPAPMMGASLHNEGKLHLGFVYANDPARQTHEIMVRGSLAFSSILERLTGSTADAWLPSEPFHYFVPRDSLLGMDAILEHFERVERAARAVEREGGHRYLGLEVDRYFERNPPERHERLFSAGKTLGSISTAERSVSPAAVAAVLCLAVEREAAVTFAGSTEILGVTRHEDGSVTVEARSDRGRASHRYASVANCLWEDKLRVDRTAGVADPGPWYQRYKTTINITTASANGVIPSATGIIGPYGDIVNRGSGSFFVSWYPLSRRAAVSGEEGRRLHAMVHPWAIARLARRLTARRPEASRLIATLGHRRFIRRNVQAMAAFVPSMIELLECDGTSEVGGGVILALGSTDIDDPESLLHSRVAIGPVAHGGYVTINTGKYCMAPLFAVEGADLVADALR